MHITTFIPALALASFTFANPIVQRRDDAPVKVTADQLKQIAPKLGDCDRAKPKMEECATAEKAAEYISNSFVTYKITKPAVAAGLIATMSVESGEFQYAHNVSPGRPGQGTRNMQMANLNKEYIDSIEDPAFKPEKDAAGSDPDKILKALIKYGNYNFGSAAWFFTKKCNPEVATALGKGDKAGWDQYVQCIGATADDGRVKYWEAAVKALGVKSA